MDGPKPEFNNEGLLKPISKNKIPKELTEQLKKSNNGILVDGYGCASMDLPLGPMIFKTK